MSDAFEQVAAGAPSSALLAYRFRAPAADWLVGWQPQVAHWPWVDAPDGLCSNRLWRATSSA